jgi:hypothetical protein
MELLHGVEMNDPKRRYRESGDCNSVFLKTKIKPPRNTVLLAPLPLKAAKF